MNSEEKIKRHGYHLMSLALLGMICVFRVGLTLVAMPYVSDWRPQARIWARISGIEWQQAIHLDSTSKAFLSLSFVAWTLSYLLPLSALRRLGRNLYRHEALTLPVANAFRWLAHSVLIGLLLQGVPDAGAGFINGLAEGYNAAGTTPIRHVPHGFGVGTTYIAIIACVCLYSVAHLMKLAAEAAEDSRSIV